MLYFFEKNLDLEESCKKSTDKPCIATYPVSLLLALYISIKIPPKSKNIILGQYYLLKLFIWISSIFCVMFLSLFQNLIWPSCCINLSCHLPFNLRSFHSSLVFHDLDTFDEYQSITLYMSFRFGLSNVLRLD